MKFDMGIVRLMACPKLSSRARLRKETALTISVANHLRFLTLEDRLSAIWFHVPNEGKRSPLHGAMMRAMGLLPGVPDFVFLAKDKSFGIEIKVEEGTMSEYQQTFKRWCGTRGVPYYVARSLDEVKSILKMENVLG